jgi:prepilin-type N-terminal cleavage/methylation domain-containing protein
VEQARIWQSAQHVLLRRTWEETHMVGLAGATGLPHGTRRDARGFSMMELLVTIILAGIIFAAMVPFFANALKRTSGDELRVDAANIAQDRIEQVRLLEYSDITAANLNYSPSPTPSPFGDGRFGPTYTQVGETKPYDVVYTVQSLPDANAKYVRVSVTREGSGSNGYVTTADTIIDNPEPGDTSVKDAEPTGLSMTVYFDNWTYVKAPGVIIRRVQTNVTPNVTTSPFPGYQMPTSGNQQLTWTDLTGGPNYTYYISCNSTKASYVLNAPPFRLWASGTLKFDTYPGGD